VRGRPAGEDPVTALRLAVRSLGADLRESPRPTPLWLFNDGPPGVRINRLSPGAVLRAESGLADVILERLEGSGDPAADYGMDTRYLAGILARTTFALIRSALIRAWDCAARQLPRSLTRASSPTRPSPPCASLPALAPPPRSLD